MAFEPYGTTAGTAAGELYTFTTAAAISAGDLCYVNSSGNIAKASAGTDGPLYVAIADVASGASAHAFLRVDPTAIWLTTAAGTPHPGLSYALDATNMRVGSSTEVDVMDIRIEVLRSVSDINGTKYAVVIHPAWDTTA